MKTISLKIPEVLHEQLEQLCKQRSVTKSDVVRSALERFFGGNSGKDDPTVSVLELADDLAGSCEGPGDLSTNKRHLDGFGK